MSLTTLLRPGLGTALLLLGGCAIFHRHRHEEPAPPPPPPAPVVAAPTPPAATPTPPKAAHDLAGAMTAVLHLRPDQTARVRRILTTTVAQANAARKQYPAQSPQLTAALRRINATSDGQLRQVLGPVTYKALQTKRAQIQAQMGKQ